MFKCPFDNKLRSVDGRPARHGAFSLTELIVAIGILVLMFSLVGQVFNVTVQSTGQARAMTQVNQWLRAVEDTMREDLRHVQPGRSLILIQGNPVNAYWTQEGLDSDDDGDPSSGYAHISDPAREKRDADGRAVLMKPRADILMFFTARRGTSYTDPGVTPDVQLRECPDPKGAVSRARVVSSDLQQVVYGHANLGEWLFDDNGEPKFEPDPNEDTNPAFPVDRKTRYPSPDIVSRVPADRWHLARRGVLLVGAPMPCLGVHPRDMTADEYRWLLQGIVDVTGWFSLDEWVMPGVDADGPWYLPKIFPDDLRVPMPFERSKLDPTPPALLADRLGHYLLPNCASFKVEWTLDPRSEFVGGRLDGTREVYWFDPGDPDDPLAELEAAKKAAEKAGEKGKELYDNLKSLLEGKYPPPDPNYPDRDYSLSERFRGEGLHQRLVKNDPEGRWPEVAKVLYGLREARPNLVVFGAARLNELPADMPSSVAKKTKRDVVPEDIFPSALRITIDVFDSERRLERPIRHVIVAPVGE